jgi:hypothetical protein
MPCTFKPMQAYGCSRSSLLQRLGIGDVWAFLRDLVQNVMFRADFYDGEGNFYHGLANSIGGEGTVSIYSGDTEGDGETVNDYWQTNPQSEEHVMTPGATSFVRSSNNYKITSPSSGWIEDGTIKELLHKVEINGEVHYGRIPLWTDKHNEANYLPKSLLELGTTVTSFAGTSDALAILQSAYQGLCNVLLSQGVARVIYRNEGGPG